MLAIGTIAPIFSLLDQNGKSVSLDDFRGKKVVLYFYPKDNTSGCTAQAKGFTDRLQEFREQNAVILGVSKDTVASHKRFEEKQELGITLLADPELTVIKEYDVWGEKNMYGKKTMGLIRTTYIINEEGVIIGAYGNVRAAKNPEKMLEEIGKV